MIVLLLSELIADCNAFTLLVAEAAADETLFIELWNADAKLEVRDDIELIALDT